MAPMIRRILPAALVMLAALAGGAADSAAQLPAQLRDGRQSLSFGVFGGGGHAGYNVMTSPRTAFTLGLSGFGSLTMGEGFRADSMVDDRDGFNFRVTLEPGFRRYLSGRGEVASYFAANLALGAEAYYSQVSAPTYTHRQQSWAPVGGVGLGYGLEWFVTDELSLRGQIGVDASYSYRMSEIQPDDREMHEHVVRASLGTTGLAATLHF